MRRRITSAKREEIEKEQEELSHTIVRPFETLSGLPVSYNPPPNGHYDDVLNNPLTLKDSAVLYNSLMRSRYNYLHSPPMFKLFWVKQSSYAKKLMEMEKEKENNPNSIPEVKTESNHPRVGRKPGSTNKDKEKDKDQPERVPVLGNEVSARDVMVKLCDGSLSLGPHFFQIRLFIVKDDRPEKPPKKKELEQEKEKIEMINSNDSNITEGGVKNTNHVDKDDIASENKVDENLGEEDSKKGREEDGEKVSENNNEVSSEKGNEKVIEKDSEKGNTEMQAEGEAQMKTPQMMNDKYMHNETQEDKPSDKSNSGNDVELECESNEKVDDRKSIDSTASTDLLEAKEKRNKTELNLSKNVNHNEQNPKQSETSRNMTDIKHPNDSFKEKKQEAGNSVAKKVITKPENDDSSDTDKISSTNTRNSFQADGLEKPKPLIKSKIDSFDGNSDDTKNNLTTFDAEILPPVTNEGKSASTVNDTLAPLTDLSHLSEKLTPISTPGISNVPPRNTSEVPSQDSSNMPARSPSNDNTKSSSTVTAQIPSNVHAQSSSNVNAQGSSNVPVQGRSQTSTPSPSTDMQSLENTIMISNLNSIAREDQSLNALMKIVASGKASQEQIMVFKEYIERARSMGPQPHHAKLFPNNQIPSAIKAKKTKIPKPPKPPKPPKVLKPPKEKKQPKEKKPLKEKKVLKEKKPPKEKKSAKEKIPKDQKLTAFQERYLHDATLLFEFVENPNIRYLLPQYSICEVIEPTNEHGANMERTDGEDSSESKDILVSFLWIHNNDEVEDYEKKSAEYQRLVKERDDEEEAKRKKTEEEEAAKIAELKKGEATNEETSQLTDNNDELIKGGSQEQKDPSKGTTEVIPIIDEVKANPENDKENSAQAKRDTAPRRGKRKRRVPPPKKTVPKKLEPPIEPEIKYTSVSFTIHQIPTRLVPIVVNSVKPQEEVYQKMQNILKVGTRLASFYLWYQVDGKLDEDLAENLRVNLVLEEKKMTGVVPAPVSKPNPTSAGPKKRKMKDKTLLKTKKIKNEDISEAELRQEKNGNQVVDTELADDVHIVSDTNNNNDTRDCKSEISPVIKKELEVNFTSESTDDVQMKDMSQEDLANEDVQMKDTSKNNLTQ